jgi:hypothetical protein
MDDHDGLPAALSRQAKAERKRFLRAYQKRLDEIRQFPLSILVWGPKLDAGNPVANKRRQIHQELIDRGHNAMFSEELPAACSFSERTKELAQIREADLAIILIEDSPGAQGEVNDFSGLSDIAPKLFVLVPDRYRGGYVAKGALQELERAHGGVFWYHPSDLAECKVASAAIERAEALRCLRYRESRQKK